MVKTVIICGFTCDAYVLKPGHLKGRGEVCADCDDCSDLESVSKCAAPIKVIDCIF